MTIKDAIDYFGGIDPSASPQKPSGCAVIDSLGRYIHCDHCYTDEEIVAFFHPYSCRAVAIDAPKGIPLGMGYCCLEDHPTCTCPPTGIRSCERMMFQEGISLYPVTKKSFAKSWIRRGLSLFSYFQRREIPAFEVFPTGSKRILFPDTVFTSPKSRKATRILLQQRLETVISSIPKVEDFLLSDHELDAILAAYTIYLYLERRIGRLLGDPREGEIVLPI